MKFKIEKSITRVFPSGVKYALYTKGVNGEWQNISIYACKTEQEALDYAKQYKAIYEEKEFEL